MLAALLLAACGGATSRTLKPAEKADLPAATLKRVALLEPRNFTPPKEAAVRIEDPLTGSLIRALRDLGRFEVVPGHAPLALEFVTAVRAWYRNERGAVFPAEAFQALVAASPSDAYLVSWIDRSSRPVVVNEKLEEVPADRYRLELVFLLFDPAGKVFFAVEPKLERKLEGELGPAVKATVDEALKALTKAFDPPVRPTSPAPEGSGGPG